MSDAVLDQIFELALQLTVAEQARLLERVAAHLANEVEQPAPDSDETFVWTDEELAELLKPGSPKTGAEIALMIESGELDTSVWSEMANPEISDPVEWLRALRADMSKKRGAGWNNQ